MKPCNTVVKYPLPCAFYRSFKMFKISPSEFATVDLGKRVQVRKNILQRYLKV